MSLSDTPYSIAAEIESMMSLLWVRESRERGKNMPFERIDVSQKQNMREPHVDPDCNSCLITSVHG